MKKTNSTNLFYLILIYRPLGLARIFFVEFGDFLLSTIKLERILLLGDFNFHIIKFNLVTESDSQNHLIMSPALDIRPVCREDIFISDHKCLLFDLYFICDLKRKKENKNIFLFPVCPLFM